MQCDGRTNRLFFDVNLDPYPAEPIPPSPESSHRRNQQREVVDPLRGRRSRIHRHTGWPKEQDKSSARMSEAYEPVRLSALKTQHFFVPMGCPPPILDSEDDMRDATHLGHAADTISDG